MSNSNLALYYTDAIELDLGREDDLERIGSATIVLLDSYEAFIKGLSIREPFQGQGYGSELLSRIIEGFPGFKLVLEPRASDSMRLSDDDLRAWYGRYGFQQDPDDEGQMIRPPGPLIHSPRL